MSNNEPKVGLVPFAELWNGRLAMIGFLAVLAIEFTSGKGVLHFWNILP